jgi:DNA-binding GntR family transcriptional regulator
MAAEATSSPSRTLAVYLRLREDVLTCRLPPGRKLIISQVCEEFDASLTIIREAFSRLAAEGLLIAEDQRGFRVRPLSSDDLADLTASRIQIEGGACAFRSKKER